MRIDNKVTIITGAAGGLGRSFALAFAEAGARIACVDLNLAGAQETTALINQQEAGSGAPVAIAIEANVADEASTQQMVQRVIEQWGQVDLLLNNAAIYAMLQRKPFWELTVGEWDRVMAVNVKGVWLCSKAVAPVMRAQKSGKIIHISSGTVFSGSPMWAHYVSSKAAVIGLTRTMARELGEDGITVNAIAPGFTLTEASLGLIENAAEHNISRGSIKRNATAEDIVGTALYLASSAADFVTGQTIIVDGGRQFI